MPLTPSPFSAESASTPNAGAAPAVSPSSASSPYWTSASSASPAAGTRDQQLPAAMPTVVRRATAPAPCASTSLDDDEVSSSLAYDEHWASPAEVLELQALCRTLAQQYQTELTKLQSELDRARRDRDALRRAVEETAPLQQAYVATKAAYEANKQGERSWQEEREIMRLQLQKLSVDNQKLRLSLEKQRRHGALGGSLTGAFTQKAGSSGPGLEPSLWASVAAPLISPAFRVGLDTATPPASHGQRLSAAGTGGAPGGVAALAAAAAAARPQATRGVEPVLTSTQPRYASAPLTPGSSNDSKLGGRVSGSGSLFADTPPRVPPPDAAGRGRGAHDRVSADRFSLATPTLSTSFPTDEVVMSAGQLGTSSSASSPPKGQTEGRRGTNAKQASAVPSSPPPQAAAAVAETSDALAQETTMPPQPSQSNSRLSGGGGGGGGSAGSAETTHTPKSQLAEEPARAASTTGAAEDDDVMNRSQPFSSSTLPTPSSSNGNNGDRRSTSTNPIYAQGVSSNLSTSTTASGPAGEDARAGFGRYGPQTVPAGAFGFDQLTALNMADKSRGEDVGGYLDPQNGADLARGDSAPTTTTSSTTVTSLSSGLSLLYRLPRGPAEALEEQVKLVEAVNHMAQRNAELEARLEHVEALWNLSASQRDQRLRATTHEKERALREVQHWSDAAASLETRVASLTSQLEDSRSAFESSQQELLETRDALHAAKKAHETEKKALRAALEETHAETIARLKGTYEDAAVALEAAHAASEAESSRVRAAAEAAQAALSTELQETHEALSRATQELRQRGEAEAARERTVQAERQRTQDQRQAVEESLSKAIHARAVLEAHVEELQSQVEHLQAMHKTQADCVVTMEARLEQACQSLAANGSAEEALALWQTRAKSVEAELETQQTFYARELRVRQTALEAMQSQHQHESLKLAKKLEQATTRYDALKLKFAAAARDKGWFLEDVTNEANRMPKKRSSEKEKQKKQKQKPEGEADEAADGEEGEEEDRISATAPEVATRARTLPCDPVQLLEASNKTASALCRSLHRPV